MIVRRFCLFSSNCGEQRSFSKGNPPSIFPHSTLHSVFLYFAFDSKECPARANRLILFTELSEAQRLGAEAIFVVDQNSITNLSPVGAGYYSGLIPSDAILNADPYVSPHKVIAAGGIVRHKTTDELLCIRRHGLLDLPKGKLDEDESIAQCAMREIQEETGIQDLHQGALLGTTVHGYRRGDLFEIKTTYWYAFVSENTQFTPALDEGIDDVRWVPYPQAVQTLGYPILQTFLMDLESVIGSEVEL